MTAIIITGIISITVCATVITLAWMGTKLK